MRKIGNNSQGYDGHDEKKVEKIPSAKRTGDDRELLETYGGKFDFTDRKTIKPLIDYVHGVCP